MNIGTSLDKFDVERVAKIFSCIVDIDKAVYISVPITTGERFISWFEKTGADLPANSYATRLSQEVIQPNIAHARKYIDDFKKTHNGIIIEPTAIDVPEWSQQNYHDFWASVINQFICKIFFVDGWYMSKGCSFEFLQACKKNIVTMDQHNQLLSISKGIELIARGISEYERVGIDTTFLQNVSLELDSLI